MNAQTINKLLTALNECTEWGQVFILDSLANYSPKDDREAQRSVWCVCSVMYAWYLLRLRIAFYLNVFASSICERITPRLAHANAAVVLSAVKVLMKFMEMLPGESDFVQTLTKKLAPPLVTLLSSEPEVTMISPSLNFYVYHICSASISSICLFSLGPVRGTAQHQPHCAETTRYFKAWNESLLC